MDIRTVALIGAGAVGSYIISGLKDKLGENLWVVAEGDRAERLKREGLVVNGERIPLNVKTPAEAKGADLLLVLVKYGALRGALPAIAETADAHTLVMSPMNGVESEEIISGVIPPEQILYSYIKIAAQRDGNSVRFDPVATQGLYFGELKGKAGASGADAGESAGAAGGNGSAAVTPEMSPRVKALTDLFDGTGVKYHLSSDIMRGIWFKYALNISKNLPQAMIGCGLGAYGDSEHVAFLSAKLREEVAQVAAAKGIDITDTKSGTNQNATTNPDARFSTLQDLDAKRPTEIDMFSGALVRMGRELGIPTPYNEFTFHVIKALEEKNSGKIR